MNQEAIEFFEALKQDEYAFTARDKEMFDVAMDALAYDDAKYHEEHGEVIVDKAVWEDAKRALEQEPSGDAVSRQAVLDLAKFDKRKGLGTIIHALDVEQLPSVNPQKSVLDKIKAEILLRDTNVKAVRTDGCCFFTAEEILEIIDKHIAEGSEKNE